MHNTIDDAEVIRDELFRSVRESPRAATADLAQGRLLPAGGEEP